MSNEKKQLNNKRANYLANIGFIILSALLIYNFFNNQSHPIECVSSSKVIDIMSLEGRYATIKLENEQIIKLHQATLKKGDNYCLNYERMK